MTNSITNRQMFFIIFVLLTAYTTVDLPQKMAQSAGRSGWIVIMAAAVIFGVAAVIIAKLNDMFQGKVFFEYSKEIVGKFFTYLIAVYYSLFFLIKGVYIKLQMTGLLKANILPKTSQFFLILMSVLLAGYVAYKGISNVARLLEIVGIMVFLVSFTFCILMLLEGVSYNILPFFDVTEPKEYLIALKRVTISYADLAILFVIPFTKINRKAPKVAFLSLMFIGVCYVLVVESTIMILGINNAITMNDSFIEAIKIIDLPVIERTDSLYLTFGLMSLFAGTIILFTGITEFACRMLPKIKRSTIVIGIGIVFLILCFWGLKISDVNDVFESFAPYLILVSNILIPVLLYVIARIKKMKKKKEAA